MIIYEVSVNVRSDLAGSFEKYMREKHIPEVLATGFFRGARLFQASENLYRTQYEAFDQNTLDQYLETQAARLREDFLIHFPAGTEVSRKIWKLLQEF